MIGERLLRYEITERLGEGGWASFYKRAIVPGIRGRGQAWPLIARNLFLLEREFLSRNPDALPRTPTNFCRSRSGKDDVYCLSYTAVLVNFLPFASVPLECTVRLLPSAATTTRAVFTTCVPFLPTNVSV